MKDTFAKFGLNMNLYNPIGANTANNSLSGMNMGSTDSVGPMGIDMINKS